MADVDHRVGRGWLLTVVHDRIGLEVTDDVLNERVVGQIADLEADLAPGQLAPRGHPILEAADGHERRDTHLPLPATLGEVVRHAYVVPARGQVHRLGPAEVAVATQDEHTGKRRILQVSVRSGQRRPGWSAAGS